MSRAFSFRIVRLKLPHFACQGLLTGLAVVLYVLLAAPVQDPHPVLAWQYGSEPERLSSVSSPHNLVGVLLSCQLAAAERTGGAVLRLFFRLRRLKSQHE